MSQNTKGAKKSNKVVNVQVVEAKPAAPAEVESTTNTEPETPAAAPEGVGANQDETPTVASNDGSVEVTASEVEDLGTEPATETPASDEEESTEPSSGLPELNLSTEADAFLSTLARFKREGLVELNQRQLENPVGKYPPERVLELFQIQKLTLPTLEVLKEAAAFVPGLRNPAKWAELMNKGRGRNSAVRQRYAL